MDVRSFHVEKGTIMIKDSRVQEAVLLTDGEWVCTLPVLTEELTRASLLEVGNRGLKPLDELLKLAMGRAIWDEYPSAAYGVGLDEPGMTNRLLQVWAFQADDGLFLTVEVWKELLPDEHTSKYSLAKVYQGEDEFLTENEGYARPFSDWKLTVDFVIERLKPKAPLGANTP